MKLLLILFVSVTLVISCSSSGGTNDSLLADADTYASATLKERQEAQTKGIDMQAGKRISDKASLEISSSDASWDKPKKYYSMFFDTNEYESMPAGLGGGGEHGIHAFHTEYEDSPWFIVDLTKEYTITQIKIWNRNDYQDRLIDPVVSTSSDKTTWTKLAQADTGIQIWLIDGKKTKARYIKLAVPKDETTALHLYKMHVYGMSIE